MAIESPVTSIIMEAYKKKIPILGICNGFQILIELGFASGNLFLNRNNSFVSKEVECNVEFRSKIYSCVWSTKMYVANSYGRYSVEQNTYNQLEKEGRFFLRYSKNEYDIDSFRIAGVCNEDKTVFGMMPHPERDINKENLKMYYIIYYLIMNLFIKVHSVYLKTL